MFSTAMLSTAEIKIVLSTLTKRRAWLVKTLDDNSLKADIRKEHLDSVKLIDSAMKKIAASAPPAKTPAKKEEAAKLSPDKASVLVAEDNMDSANLLMDILQDMGVKNVDLAKDGMEAFDKMKSQRYDLILCDWDMPELNGLEVHAKAKASKILGSAYFMMVTAVSEAARIREAIQQGVNDYIVKPIDIDVLENKIKNCLELQSENKT